MLYDIILILGIIVAVVLGFLGLVELLYTHRFNKCKKTKKMLGRAEILFNKAIECSEELNTRLFIKDSQPRSLSEAKEELDQVVSIDAEFRLLYVELHNLLGTLTGFQKYFSEEQKETFYTFKEFILLCKPGRWESEINRLMEKEIRFKSTEHRKGK